MRFKRVKLDAVAAAVDDFHVGGGGGILFFFLYRNLIIHEVPFVTERCCWLPSKLSHPIAAALSHAAVSTNFFHVKARMWNSSGAAASALDSSSGVWYTSSLVCILTNTAIIYHFKTLHHHHRMFTHEHSH